eukprot:ANDGO_01310.mRNA.1 hypothetical protein
MSNFYRTDNGSHPVSFDYHALEILNGQPFDFEREDPNFSAPNVVSLPENPSPDPKVSISADSVDAPILWLNSELLAIGELPSFWEDKDGDEYTNDVEPSTSEVVVSTQMEEEDVEHGAPSNARLECQVISRTSPSRCSGTVAGNPAPETVSIDTRLVGLPEILSLDQDEETENENAGTEVGIHDSGERKSANEESSSHPSSRLQAPASPVLGEETQGSAIMVVELEEHERVPDVGNDRIHIGLQALLNALPVFPTLIQSTDDSPTNVVKSESQTVIEDDSVSTESSSNALLHSTVIQRIQDLPSISCLEESSSSPVSQPDLCCLPTTLLQIAEAVEFAEMESKNVSRDSSKKNMAAQIAHQPLPTLLEVLRDVPEIPSLPPTESHSSSFSSEEQESASRKSEWRNQHLLLASILDSVPELPSTGMPVPAVTVRHSQRCAAETAVPARKAGDDESSRHAHGTRCEERIPAVVLSSTTNVQSMEVPVTISSSEQFPLSGSTRSLQTVIDPQPPSEFPLRFPWMPLDDSSIYPPAPDDMHVDRSELQGGKRLTVQEMRARAAELRQSAALIRQNLENKQA